MTCIVLITGDCEWQDEALIEAVLRACQPQAIIEGECLAAAAVVLSHG